MRRLLKQGLALWLTLAMLFSLVAFMPLSASATTNSDSLYGELQAKASKKPKVASLQSLTFYWNFDDAGSPTLAFSVRYNTYSKNAKLYLEIYKGSKKVYSGYQSVKGNATFSTDNETDGDWLLQLKSGMPAVTMGVTYTAKVYVKSSVGKSNVLSKSFRTPVLP